MSGCCDGNPEDDLKLPNGTVVREVGDMMLFLHAWRVHTNDETEHTRRVGDNCTIEDCSTCLSMLRLRAFMPCHSKVAPVETQHLTSSVVFSSFAMTSVSGLIDILWFQHLTFEDLSLFLYHCECNVFRF